VNAPNYSINPRRSGHTMASPFPAVGGSPVEARQSEFAPNSSLERTGFELVIPPQISTACAWSHDWKPVWRVAETVAFLIAGLRGFDSGPLHRRVDSH